MTECHRVDCHAEGTRQPVLLVMPANRPDYTGPPVEMTLGMVVCDPHQADTGADDLVGDEGWQQITQVFAAMGRAAPDRSTIGLAWRLPELGPFGRQG